jgi:hypothetical protein
MGNEPTTKRLTSEWKTHAEEAKEGAESMRAASRAVAIDDMDQAGTFGEYAAICVRYKKLFKRWPDKVVPYPQKTREVARWKMLKALIEEELLELNK